MPNHKLTAVDAANFLPRAFPPLFAQVLFGLALAVAMILLRSAIDLVAPNAGPFALVYPMVLIATLFGRLLAGLICLIVSFLWAWYVVLPFHGSFAFEVASDQSRVLINFLSSCVVVALAEVFRAAVRVREAELHESLERRRWLMAELQHRTKNNFALVASMLELQKRRIPQRELHAPLDDAVGRVRTFADAYSALALEQSDEPNVSIKPYLEFLLDRIEAQARNELARIASLEVACATADARDGFLGAFAAAGLAVSETEELSDAAGRVFAEMIALKRA